MKIMVGAALSLLIGAAAWAQAPASKQEEPRKKEWYDTIKIGGDFRLRYEEFQQDGTPDRIRERFRLRLNLDSKLADSTRLRLALRTGDPADPVSDNQTFSGGFGKKDFNIAEAYLNWNPSKMFRMNAGKFPWKDVRVTSDMAWDDDVNVEGLAERVRFAAGKEGAFTLGFWQAVLIEQGAENETYLFGLQPYYELKTDSVSLIVGSSYEQFRNPDYVAKATFDKKLAGNPLTNAYSTTADGKFDALLSDFEIVEGFVHFQSGKWGFQGHYFVNAGAFNDQDTAYFLRAAYGGTKEKGEWDVRYTYYHMETESLFYAFVQSDITIGTNNESHRFDFDYALTSWGVLGGTLYLTDRIEGDDKQLTRFMLDFSAKF